MIAKTWKKIDKESFMTAFSKCINEIQRGVQDDLTWLEESMEGQIEFCYKGVAYREFLGSYEKGRVSL